MKNDSQVHQSPLQLLIILIVKFNLRNICGEGKNIKFVICPLSFLNKIIRLTS